MIYISSLILCGGVFIGFGIFALKKQTPIHFWSGTVVKTEQIRDVKAYNRANGIMWIVYGSLIILSGIPAAIFDIDMFAIISIIIIFLGLIVMIIIYNKIYNKYKV